MSADAATDGQLDPAHGLTEVHDVLLLAEATKAWTGLLSTTVVVRLKDHNDHPDWLSRTPPYPLIPVTASCADLHPIIQAGDDFRPSRPKPPQCTLAEPLTLLSDHLGEAPGSLSPHSPVASSHPSRHSIS